MSWFDLKGRSLISELDWTREEYDLAMKLTDQLKGLYYSRSPHPYLEYKTFAMLFFSGSTRTRMSFEAAMTQLGGHSQFLNLHLWRGQDVLGRCDGFPEIEELGYHPFYIRPGRDTEFDARLACPLDILLQLLVIGVVTAYFQGVSVPFNRKHKPGLGKGGWNGPCHDVYVKLQGIQPLESPSHFHAYGLEDLRLGKYLLPGTVACDLEGIDPLDKVYPHSPGNMRLFLEVFYLLGRQQSVTIKERKDEIGLFVNVIHVL